MLMQQVSVDGQSRDGRRIKLDLANVIADVLAATIGICE